MQLEHEFRAPAHVTDVWPLLLDVERVAPCLPGAEVIGRTGDHRYDVAMKVAMGPMRMRYLGQMSIEEIDEGARRTVMMASAKEARGQGTANAAITVHLAEDGDETRVSLATELDLTGRVAQMGRGMVEQVADELLKQFASCLAGQVERQSSQDDQQASTDAPIAPQAQAINPFRLVLRAWIARFRRRFGKAHVQ